MERGGKRDGAGRPALPPEEKAKPYGVKLPPAVIEMIKAKADQAGVSQARLITQAVEAYQSDTLVP